MMVLLEREVLILISRSEAELQAIFTKNLNKYIEASGQKQIDIANAIGVPVTTFNTWVMGNAIPRMGSIQRLADYFGIKKSDLLEDHSIIEKIGLPMKRIPILGRISAGLPLLAEEHVEGYTLTTRNGGNEYFALRVVGDSMTAAGINPGNTIIVRRQSTVEDGDIAVVMVDDEDATVKRFHRGGTMITLSPQSYNPEHLPQMYDVRKTRIRVVGKVVDNIISFE